MSSRQGSLDGSNRPASSDGCRLHARLGCESCDLARAAMLSPDVAARIIAHAIEWAERDSWEEAALVREIAALRRNRGGVEP